LHYFNYVKSNILFVKDGLMTPTTTPIAMPTTARIQFYIICDHVKSNMWYFKGDVTPTAMPTTAHHQFYTNCNTNHSPCSILHDF
jgi:hypothetical protein